MKSIFLHGELLEDVYIEQPKCFEIEGENGNVYKLRKALYGLRQAPDHSTIVLKVISQEMALKSATVSIYCL